VFYGGIVVKNILYILTVIETERYVLPVRDYNNKETDNDNDDYDDSNDDVDDNDVNWLH